MSRDWEKGEVREEEGVEVEGEGKAAAGMLGEAVGERGVEAEIVAEVDKDGIQTLYHLGDISDQMLQSSQKVKG